MAASVVEVLELGGMSNRSTLASRTSRAAVEGAVAVGDLIRLGRSRYAGADLAPDQAGRE